MEVTKITTSLEKKNMQEKTKMTVDVWDKSMKTWRRSVKGEMKRVDTTTSHMFRRPREERWMQS